MKKILWFSCMLSFAFYSCEKANDIIGEIKKNTINPDGFVEYVIPKNGHTAIGSQIKMLNTKTLQFQAKFDSSCIYYNIDPVNQLDINKLYGFIDGGIDPHVNSARFGWRWTGKEIEILAYTYANSVRQSKLLGSVQIGAKTDMALYLKAGYYMFDFKGKTDSLPRVTTNATITGYQLYPYFGGDETAPHEMRIYIKDK